MKHRVLFVLNFIFYVVTIFLYIKDGGYAYGLISQFFLGVFQLVIALYCTVYNRSKKLGYKKEIKWYWYIVALYVILLLIPLRSFLDKQLFILLFMVITPMNIGIYNLYVNYLIQKT